MSELKAYLVYTPMDSTAEGMYEQDSINIEGREVYLADEADKVIAEKDAEIVELKKQVHDYALGLYVMQARAEKETRHHKYKRCLAMADRCRERFLHYVVLVAFSPNKGAISFYNRRRDRAYKWMYKWRELAEKFKEAK